MRVKQNGQQDPQRRKVVGGNKSMNITKKGTKPMKTMKAMKKETSEYGVAKKDDKKWIFYLKREPYDVMITGEKQLEFRIASSYWRRRLLNRDGSPKIFDILEFSLGYGSNRPKFQANHVGTRIISEYHHTWSNGLCVTFTAVEYIVVELGTIVWSQFS